MKRRYKDLVWHGLTATGVMVVTNDDGSIVEQTAFSESLSDMLITMARDENPSWNPASNPAEPVRQAKELLGRIPVPFVQGFVVDTGEFFDTWEPKQMHRVCFARLNDARVGRGEQRHRWIDPMTVWPEENICDYCKQTSPPSQDAYEATPELIDMAFSIADEGAITILNSELLTIGGSEEWLDLRSAQADAFAHCEHLIDYLFKRHRIRFDPKQEYVFRITEPIE